MLDVVVGRVGRRLWGVIGLSSSIAIGCGPAVEDGGDGEDETGGMSASGPMTEGPPTASGGPGSGSGSGSSASGSGSSETVSGTDTASTTWQNDCGDDVMKTVCVDPDGGSSDDGSSGSASNGDTTLVVDDTGGGTEGSGDTEGLCDGVQITDYSFCVYGMSEVFVEDGQCCAVLSGTEECCDGRPFFVQGHARTAAVHARADWAASLVPALDRLTEGEREALARVWADDGLMEHASVASFARFALQLVAVGAPPALLVDTQQAILDEVEHARLCFGLASAYAGRAIGPGPLAVEGALAGQTDLVAAVVATVREGCIGETIAAVHAELAAGKARDPAVRAVLRQIAEDEARHAALAWRFVAWAVSEGGDAVRRAVADAFAGEPAGRPAEPPPLETARWHAHGRLTDADHAELVHRTCRDVIAPLARGLLARAVPAPPPALEKV